MDIKIGRSERLWERTTDIKGKTQEYITSNGERSRYYLYRANSAGGYEKIKSGKNPLELRRK